MEIIATVIGVGLLNLGTLIFFLGGQKEKVRAHGEDISILKTDVKTLQTDFAELKGGLGV